MKYKLLAVSTEREVNIGDYIQALASAQFLPHIDGFIQREEPTWLFVGCSYKCSSEINKTWS